MATRYIGITATDGPQVIGSDVIGADSGGTLAGGQNAQLVFDDAVYASDQESKQRLLAAVALIAARIASARTWPIDSTS